MNSLYLILLALFLLVIIPRIMQRRRLAAIRHILNQKLQKNSYGFAQGLVLFIMWSVWSLFWQHGILPRIW